MISMMMTTTMMIGSMTMKGMISCLVYSEIEVALEGGQALGGHNEALNVDHQVQVHKDALLAEALQVLHNNEAQLPALLGGLQEGQLEPHPAQDLLEGLTQGAHRGEEPL